MTTPIRRIVFLIPGQPPAAPSVLFLVLALVAGCGTTQPSRFYILAPMARAEATDAIAPGVSLIVGPVEIPAYLERPQIVTRTGSNELDIAEFHRWAAPLKGSVSDILAENLAILLGTDRVAVFPETPPATATPPLPEALSGPSAPSAPGSSFSPETPSAPGTTDSPGTPSVPASPRAQAAYRLAVDFQRFEGDSSGNVLLEARWTLSEGPERAVLAARSSSITKPVADPDDYGSLAAAASEALADFSREIAAAMRGARK